MAGGTEIDAETVSRAGVTYSDVATTLAASKESLRDHGATPAAFGQRYRVDGERCVAAVAQLGAALKSWSDGSRAVGTGLTASAAAHTDTDTDGATAIRDGDRG